MNKDFDFNKIGKRMPYTTPNGFFDKLEDDIGEKVKNDKAAVPEMPQVAHKAVKRHLFFIRSAVAVAASAALVLIVSKNISKTNSATINDVDQAFSQLTADDQTYLRDIYNDDVFICE